MSERSNITTLINNGGAQGSGQGVPVYYDYNNVINSVVQPSTVHIRNTSVAFFFRRYLYQKAMSVFKWTLPENWNKNYFLYSLYVWGFCAVVKTDKYGVIPQACGLRGYNVMYQPTNAIISNPLLTGILTPRIDKECTLIRLQPDYGGLNDMVEFYGNMLALTAESAGVNLLNSHLAYVFLCQSKTAAESFKKMMDRVYQGEPSVFIDKGLFSDDEDGKLLADMFTQNIGGNYIADKLMVDLKKWENDFCTNIGLPNANTEKKERLITDEVNANNVETISLADSWLEELKKSCEKTRDMFGIDISVDWRYKPDLDGDNMDDREEAKQ